MEENVSNKPDHRIQRRTIGSGGGGGGGGGQIGQIVRSQRYLVEDDCTSDTIECTGKSCRSCAGGMIADCVALCCCPCAVVNILTLTFLKVPWMMGRKCLGLGKKNKKKLKKIDDDLRRDSGWGESMMMEIGEGRNGICRNEEGRLGIEKFEDDDNNYSARIEAEKVWMELYQVGHLGFGRVSFTGNGIQSIGKGNSGN